MDIEEQIKKGGGFKVNYSEVRKAVLKCELDSKDRNESQACRKMFKDLGIDIIE